MDYLKFVEHHRATNADITIGCLPVDYERASDFGLMKVNDDGEIFVRLQCLPCSTYSSFGDTPQSPSLNEGQQYWRELCAPHSSVRAPRTFPRADKTKLLCLDSC